MQTAKVQLSALVQLAIKGKPQFITLRGEPAVVVLSQKDYESILIKLNCKKS